MVHMESHIIELQMRLTHQDLMIEELNKVVYEQQRAIEALESKLTSLIQRLGDFSQNSRDIGPANEKPPHY